MSQTGDLYANLFLQHYRKTIFSNLCIHHHIIHYFCKTYFDEHINRYVMNTSVKYVFTSVRDGVCGDFDEAFSIPD
jgi:hypothetical protein